MYQAGQDSEQDHKTPQFTFQDVMRLAEVIGIWMIVLILVTKLG